MTRVSSCLGLVSWMYLHLTVDVHSGIRTQYRSLRTSSRSISVLKYQWEDSSKNNIK
ncbi:unnamed protein product [Schistosoma margrebowiei]|uniref:Uncharacterized protein n=1 Tax=Schistosoma margrebowiei TaxID=48269 RepID=A0A183LB94_9TREM|nr:unnamed protein product [Schistosoma margrebowiei]